MRKHLRAGFFACGLLSGSNIALAQSVQTVANGNVLVTVSPTAPGTVISSIPLSGIGAGQVVTGIDYRPASPRILYAISNIGQIYAVNARTGVASAVGTPPLPTIGNPGFDFNPTVDRIRINTQTRQNFRANPDTGALAAVDGNLAYAAGDPLAGAIVNVAGAAYTNSFAGATTTTLYVIDTRGALAPAQLATQGNAVVSPNSGTLFSIGSTGVTTLGDVGFDIDRGGAALATLTNPSTRVTSLYSINLTTGAATLLGTLPGNQLYEGLAIALAPFATMGATANQNAVGAQLDQFTGVPSGQTLALLNAIDSLYVTPSAQAAALSSLTPGAYSSLPNLSLNAVEVTETNVLRYTRDLRGRGSLPDGSVATLDSEGRVGAWIVGGARFGTIDAAVDRPKVKSDEVHFLGGVDYRFAASSAIGIFGGYSKTDAHLTPISQRSTLKSWFGGAYGTVSLGPVYVDAWGSYTDLDWERLNRSIVIGGFNAQMNGFTEGHVYAAGASTGLSFNFGGLEVEPFVAGRYARVKVRGFSELGGAVTALNVGRQDVESLRGIAGARVGISREIAGALVRVQGRGGYYHEFKNDAQVFSASFISPTVGTTSFPFVATRLRRNYYNAGAALDISGGGPLSLVADYDAQFDKDRQFHSLTVGARLAF
ncbi:MAG: DUF4394 domain-containing protein [Novosphingobium sp.]